MTIKGRATIPDKIRHHLKLKAGDGLEFLIEPDGRVILMPTTVDIAELKGLLAPAPRRVSAEEMDHAVRSGAARRYATGH